MASNKGIFVRVVLCLLLFKSSMTVDGLGFYSFGSTPGGAIYNTGVTRTGGAYNFGRAPGGLLYNHGVTRNGGVYSSTASKLTGLNSYIASPTLGVHGSGIRPNGGIYGYGTRPLLEGLFGRKKRHIPTRRYSNLFEKNFRSDIEQ